MAPLLPFFFFCSPPPPPPPPLQHPPTPPHPPPATHPPAPPVVTPPRASPDTPRPGTQARRSGQTRNDQLAAEIPLRRRTKVPPLRFAVKDFLNPRSVAAADQLAEGTD